MAKISGRNARVFCGGKEMAFTDWTIEFERFKFFFLFPLGKRAEVGPEVENAQARRRSEDLSDIFLEFRP